MKKTIFLLYLVFAPLVVWGEPPESEKGWREWFVDLFREDKDVNDDAIGAAGGPGGHASTPTYVCQPEQLGALAIAEWRNTSMVSSFVEYTKKYLLNDNQCFVHFDSFDGITVWAAPFGFYSKYQTPVAGNGEIEVNQTTFGVGSGVSFTVIDHLTVGAGLGYFYSSLDWEGDAHSNSVFLGPYVSYLFPQGFVGLTLFGVGNFYGGNFDLCDNREIDMGHTSWNIVTRLEGGIDLEVPEVVTKDLFVHPYVRLDYLNVFEGDYAGVEGRYSSYFRSLASLRFSKTVLCTKTVFLTPNISMGWVKWVPVTSDDVEVEDLASCGVKGESKDQLLLGGELVFFQKPSFLLGIGYEAFIGSQAPLQVGKIRFEWSW